MTVANLMRTDASHDNVKMASAVGWTARLEPWIYVFALGFSETVSDLHNAVIGGWLHLTLSAWLLYRGSFLYHETRGKYYIFYSILPLIRLISLSTSPTLFRGVWFYSVTEALVLVSALFAARTVGLGTRQMGVSMPRHLWLVPIVIVTGMISGCIEYHFIHPTALSTSLEWTDVWLPCLLLLIFTGFTEEVVFRGITYTLASRFYSPLMTVLISTVGWTMLHIEWHSWKDLLLVFATGFVWGWARQYMQSVIPLALSHGMANIMLFVIMPNL